MSFCGTMKLIVDKESVYMINQKKILSMLLCFALVIAPLMSNGEAAAKKKIRLNRKKATLYVGKKLKLKVKGTKKKVTWKSKKKKIATVSKKGVVKAKKAGKTSITARVAGKSKKLVCKITVKTKKKKIEQNDSTARPSASSTVRPSASPTSDVPTSGTDNPGSNQGQATQPTASVAPGATASTTPSVSSTPSASSAATGNPTQTPTSSPIPATKAEPVFSQKSGSYQDAFDLELSAPEGSTIYYTTDGSIPLYEDGQGTVVKEGTPLTLAADREEFGSSDVTTEYTSEGVKISYTKQYNSICFKAPDGVTDWTGYRSIAIEYTVNQVGSGGQTLGLQVVPIYAKAESSWNGTGGKSDTTRIHETRQDLSGSGVAQVSLQDGSDYSSVGRLMLGVYNDNNGNGAYSSKAQITIHAIHLLREGEKYQSANTTNFPAKLPTNQYKNPIRIKNRDLEPNLLCSEANIPYMYDPSDYNNRAFYPEISGVPKATVIRALAVDADGNRSKVVTRVYFVGKNLQQLYKGASVVSLVTDPDNLLSESIGIYRYGNWENGGDEWERPAEVTYFEDTGAIPFETTVGVRIHGNYTRRWGQKSFRLYFREEYGMKNLKGYQLIPGAVNADGSPTKKYKKLILRNGGNEYAYSKMQDVFIQSMVSDRAFATQSSRPCVVYLNGEYWGLYNLMERYSDNYLEEEYGVDKSNVVVIKNGELDEGIESDFSLYEQLKAMADEDFSKPATYERFKEMVDIQSLLDYYATEIYIGNMDWPGNNTELWRTRTNDGTTYGDTKWRYMLYDTEYSMNLWGQDPGGSVNRIERAKEKDRLFNALCQNGEFCQAFADTLMEICRQNFNLTKATEKLDAMAEIYRPLMEQYHARFGNGDPDSRIRDMKSYIAGRESQLKEFIQSSFGITVK